MSDIVFSKISLSEPTLRLRLRREDARFNYDKRKVKLIKDSDLQGITIPVNKVRISDKSSFLKAHLDTYPVNRSTHHQAKNIPKAVQSPILQYIQNQAVIKSMNDEPVISENKASSKNITKGFKKSIFKYGVTGLAILLISLGIYLTIVGWKANLIKEQPNKLTTMANQLSNSDKNKNP